jgi:asparagine synthase (glutamine-hydrolysing)
MCGIAGTVNIDLNEKTLEAIAHRGPDDFGISKHTFGNDVITLGHRRLSIVDLSPAGHQPMRSADYNVEIVFNGEIYNHDSLRQELTDISFMGHSDTETMTNYISRFGIESVCKLNGIFSFGLVNRKEGALYLVRDRYGVKPMYYLHKDDKFVFSSEIRLIRKLFDVTLSKSHLAELLRLRYCPAPDTLFGEVRKLRPGHILRYDLKTKRISEHSYVQPPTRNSGVTMRDAQEQYGILFEQAVKRQLMSDVDVGILLSGGVDSALVALYAQKYSAKKLKTFTVGFDEANSDANELNEARATAAYVGTDHHEVMISSSQFEKIFQTCISIIEEPLGTTSVIPMYFLNEMVSKHLKVVLTGQGADEPLGGYGRYQGELWRSFLPGIAFDVAKRLGEIIKNEKILRGANSLGEKDPVKRFDKIYSLFTHEEIKGLIGETNSLSIDRIGHFYDLLEGRERPAIEAMMSVDMRMNLADDLLLYTDKVSMNFSIETRVPLLDNDLAGFIESLPYNYRLRLGEGKLIHKRFAEKVLPREIVYRKKKGFYSPTNAWFRGATGSMLREKLTQRNTKFATHFDTKVVDQIFQQHIGKGFNREKQLYTLVSIFYWLEEYS